MIKAPNLVNGVNNSVVKTQNISAILMALLLDHEMSRARLAESIGLSNATVTNLVAELTAQGILAEEGQIRQGPGRPHTVLKIIATAYYVIGIHLDVDSVHITITNLFAEQIDSITLSLMRDIPWEIVLNASVSAAEDLIERHQISREKFLGVGIAATGLVNSETGVNIVAPNMRWHDVPLQEYFQTKLVLPVIADNNVRAMALYESLFGSAKYARTLAFVYARIGMGAGLVVDRQLYHGSGAGAGEIGHTTMIFEGGKTCRCGNTGCLETIFSEPTLMELSRDILEQHPKGVLAQMTTNTNSLTIDNIFMAAQQGDEDIKQMLLQQSYYVGIALANLVNIFNPELILLGGIFAKERNTILPHITRIVQDRAFGGLGNHVQIKTTNRGTSIGMEGAATLALDHFFYRPLYKFL